MLPLLLLTNINKPTPPPTVTSSASSLVKFFTSSELKERTVYHHMAMNSTCDTAGHVVSDMVQFLCQLRNLLAFCLLRLNLKFWKSRVHVFFSMYATLITPYLAQRLVHSEYLTNVSLFSITGAWLWIKFVNQQTKSKIFSQVHMWVYNICTFTCKYVCAYIFYIYIYSFLHKHTPMCLYIYT